MDIDDTPMPPAVFHILTVLAGGEQHGYGILRAVRERTGGRVKLGPGTLYRSIQRMLHVGLIEELTNRPDPDREDERRRYYRITRLGRQAARAEAARLADLVALARASGLTPRKA